MEALYGASMIVPITSGAESSRELAGSTRSSLSSYSEGWYNAENYVRRRSFDRKKLEINDQRLLGRKKDKANQSRRMKNDTHRIH